MKTSLTHSLPHSSLSFIITLFLFVVCGNNLLFSQEIEPFHCEVLVDTNEVHVTSRGLKNSENGWYLSASVTIRILVVFAEINYSPSSLDPSKWVA